MSNPVGGTGRGWGRAAPRSRGAHALLLLALVALPLLFSCGDRSPTGSTPVTLVLPDTALFRVGEQRLLGGVDPGDLAWTSSEPTVASVSESGAVTALAPGEAVIVATMAANPGWSDSVTVTVLPMSLRMGTTMVTLLTGQVTQLHAAAVGAVDSSVIWRSDAPAVAAVAGNGLVTARATGVATLTALARADTVVRESVHVAVNLQLTVGAATITQVTQTAAGDVPLVAGRPGLLRVFVSSNLPNDLAPLVRVRLYQGGAQLAAWALAPVAPGVPLAGVDDSLAAPWSVVVPGALLQPGVSLLVDVDPAGEIVQPDRAADVFPASAAPRPLDVRLTAPMQVTLVPVLLDGGTDAGQVDENNPDGFLRDARRMFPTDSFDAELHPVFTSSATTTTTQAAWSQIIAEIQTLQVAEGSNRLYYGVLRDEPGHAWCGLSFVGGRAAIGVDACGSLVAAHEWGHNFGRLHAPCGNPLNPDQLYPYPGAAIGSWGWDESSGARFRPAAFVDVMSYCDPEWISDYTYRGILEFRGATEAAAQATPAPQATLLVWGRIAADGTVVLEPAFDVDAPPALPTRSGPYTLTGIGPAGQRLFSLSFSGSAVGDGPTGSRWFAFAVPRSWAAGELTTLRLTRAGGGAATLSARSVGIAAAGPSVTASASLRPGGRHRRHFRWDATVYPMALLRDPVTGAVLGFARGGAATVAGDGGEVDVTFSDGVRSVRRKVSLTP